MSQASMSTLVLQRHACACLGAKCVHLPLPHAEGPMRFEMRGSLSTVALSAAGSEREEARLCHARWVGCPREAIGMGLTSPSP